MKKILLLMFIILLTGAGVFAKKGSRALVINDIPPSDLSASEKKGLLQMREEEKLARDVYLYLYGKFKLEIFKTISSSEQQHMDSVLLLLDRYSIKDPVGSDRSGVFENTELQELYNKLTGEGSVSPVEALKTGASIEDLDIMDLQKLLKTNDNEDIEMVYENLMKGSRNHLRSFVKQLKQNRGDYKPQYISSDEYNSIINSPVEKGAY